MIKTASKSSRMDAMSLLCWGILCGRSYVAPSRPPQCMLDTVLRCNSHAIRWKGHCADSLWVALMRLVKKSSNHPVLLVGDNSTTSPASHQYFFLRTETVLTCEARENASTGWNPNPTRPGCLQESNQKISWCCALCDRLSRLLPWSIDARMSNKSLVNGSEQLHYRHMSVQFGRRWTQ